MSVSLSEKLERYRTDRPDEWTMDEFARDAKDLETKIQSLQQRIQEAERLLDIYREKNVELLSVAPVGQDIAKQVSIALARQFYGDNSNPTPEQMSCLRVLVYDDEQGELLESVAADIAESMQPPTEEQ